ncbi:hypothetical protein [Limimaricola hongkongensis]|uniref:Uncharacterized protein n=1 Tax=Limimaricola hongkongensis DSM 17492 TaxID=1122180 RepID=A0A017HBD4_9RHOB|nr:hypothetical protein [Limimaricola hongkongensis]EYD71822.1 hypothetical protein Lokhon_01892 [Limimaricola hongkongensis DSM 17492]
MAFDEFGNLLAIFPSGAARPIDFRGRGILNLGSIGFTSARNITEAEGGTIDIGGSSYVSIDAADDIVVRRFEGGGDGAPLLVVKNGGPSLVVIKHDPSSINLFGDTDRYLEIGDALMLVLSGGVWLEIGAPARVRLSGLDADIIADQATAEEGVNNSGAMTPQRTTQHFNYRINEAFRYDLRTASSKAALLLALGGRLSTEIDLADLRTRAEARLADERAQATQETARLTAEQTALILGRLAAAEAALQTLNDMAESNMTTYPLAATVTTTAAQIVAASEPTRLQVLNKSDTATVGIAFGTAPTALNDAGVITLKPGAALDTALISATPIYAIASEQAAISGAFAVKAGEPNPNWEADVQAIFTRMGSAPSYLWQDAYRRLYSALRRAGIVGPNAKALGVYPMAAHTSAAALVNWAGTGSATAVASPSFTAAQGYAFDGSSQYLDTGRQMNGFTTTTDVTALIWPDATDQATGKAGMGDGAFALEPNRSPTEVAVKGVVSTGVDVATIPALGAYFGMTRQASDRYTVHLPGGGGQIFSRASLVTYPIRPVYIGATNSSAGVADFYAGKIKAALFGRALSAVQVLAAETAFAEFFDRAATAQAAEV